MWLEGWGLWDLGAGDGWVGGGQLCSGFYGGFYVGVAVGSLYSYGLGWTWAFYFLWAWIVALTDYGSGVGGRGMFGWLWWGNGYMDAY